MSTQVVAPRYARVAKEVQKCVQEYSPLCEIYHVFSHRKVVDFLNMFNTHFVHYLLLCWQDHEISLDLFSVETLRCSVRSILN